MSGSLNAINVAVRNVLGTFSAVPIGRNKLDRMVKDIFAEANISGKTNHSLRATGATQIYNHGIREKTIQV